MNAEESPLQHSKQELRAARLALEGMRVARNLEEFAVSWRSFLDRIEKVWVKAERECQPFRSCFEPWQGTFKALRKNDALLRYLHQARHADQHSIQPTTQELIAQLQLVIPPLGTVELQLDEEKQTLTVNGECLVGIIRGPSYLLLPIENRGTTFAAPTEHLGVQLLRNDALLVAEKGLAFYEDFVAKAGAEFFPGSA
jgi:hypothetical protein